MLDQKLDSYLSNYTQFNDWLIQRRYQHLEKFFKGKTCLEMGSADGTGTQYLLNYFKHVTIVDGSKEVIEFVSKKLNNPELTSVHSYFEDMNLGDKKFDTIVLAHILEHVNEPWAVLKKAKEFLAEGGVMIIDVPNGNSLHRQVGEKMGLLNNITDLNDADISIGHQRVYTPESFKREIKSAGLNIKKFGGMFIKVLSNKQTEKIFTKEQLEALFEVGENNPDVAAEIFIISN